MNSNFTSQSKSVVQNLSRKKLEQYEKVTENSKKQREINNKNFWHRVIFTSWIQIVFLFTILGCVFICNDNSVKKTIGCIWIFICETIIILLIEHTIIKKVWKRKSLT